MIEVDARRVMTVMDDVSNASLGPLSRMPIIRVRVAKGAEMHCSRYGSGDCVFTILASERG